MSRRQLIPFDCGGDVSGYYPIAIFIAITKVELRISIALGRREPVVSDGFYFIFRHPNSIVIAETQVNLRSSMALGYRESIVSDGFPFIFRHLSSISIATT